MSARINKTNDKKMEHVNRHTAGLYYFPILRRGRQFTVSSLRSILDIPDEILLQILLQLNARERAVLGHFSDRFNRLVFEDKKLLRDLDFSNEGRLVSASDIRRYFKDEDTNKHILKVNLRNVNCIEPQRMLNDYIGKALNLVDINVHGIEFKDLPQLGSFLKPLVLVRRLSFDWPVIDYSGYGDILQALEEPFGRIIYLSVKTFSAECFNIFIYASKVCQQLKELRVVHKSGEGSSVGLDEITICLENLESFEFCGDSASSMKQELLELLPDPEEWKGIRLADPLDEKCFYLVKEIEVCEELAEVDCVEYLPDSWEWTLGFRVRPETLLRMVIRITQENIPEEFCSRRAHLDSDERCALKIEDTMVQLYSQIRTDLRESLGYKHSKLNINFYGVNELLLKNPRHQIKYLYLNESIGTKCEVHLFSLASPSLTELYLNGMTKIKTSASEETNFREQNNSANGSPPDRSFEMLVENTPLVEDLTLNGGSGELKDDETWDLEPLSSIQGWKNLQSLRLLSIPISDGKFLIEIGKRCNFLEKLEFYNLGPSHVCCYIEDLLLMLSHCKNLTDFSMRADNMGQVSELLGSLAKNVQLRRVRLTSFGEMNNATNLISSVEQLLRRCSKLITFVCIIDGISKADSDQLTSVLRRLRVELDRPSLQFQVVPNSDLNVSSKLDRVFEDSVPPSFPNTWEDCSYLEKSDSQLSGE